MNTLEKKLQTLLGDAPEADLTALKTASIVVRSGYKITGFVVCHTETHERCIVEMSACRWLADEEMWWLMHVSESLPHPPPAEQPPAEQP